MRRGDVKITCALALILALLSVHAFHGALHDDHHRHGSGPLALLAGAGAAARLVGDEHAAPRCPVCEFLNHSHACAPDPDGAPQPAPAQAHPTSPVPVVPIRHRRAPFGPRAPPAGCTPTT